MKLSPLLEATSGLPHIWVVVNPRSPDDELGDFMFQATPPELFLIAKGTQEDPRTLDIKFYVDEFAARRDADTRMEDAHISSQAPDEDPYAAYPKW